MSYLLLYTLLEAQRKLLLQTGKISELSAARDDVRDRLTSELMAAQLRCHRLEEARLREKETALLRERIFEAQYTKVNAFWKRLVWVTPAFNGLVDRVLIRGLGLVLQESGSRERIYACHI